MTAKDNIASSTLAFSSQEYEKALEYAKEAIKEEPKNASAYKCAADAYLAMDNMGKAIESLTAAVRFDASNGNRYFDLGFVHVMNGSSGEGIKNLAKAEELGCSADNLLQLYNILGIMCFDSSRYDDALINFNKAEKLYGLDIDILQRKAVIYGLKEDVRNGLITANQIKLIAPSEYIGYKLAFNFLLQKNDFVKAEKELEKAKNYAKITMEYYTDCVQLEIEKRNTDKNDEHFIKSLKLIEYGLAHTKPSVKDVIEAYINAAEIYQQLKQPEQVIECLGAAGNPCESYNNGFKILFEKEMDVELTDYAVEDMIAEDRRKIEEKYGEYGLEELVASTEPDELGNRDYFTEIDVESETQTPYVLEEDDTIEISDGLNGQINRLYIGAYTMLKDYEQVINYSRKLQTSQDTQFEYLGKYTEVNAMKNLNMDDADQRYEELIQFFKNAMIKNPTDMMAVSLRAQCYLDIGKYDEAERLCSLLPKDSRNSLMEVINKVKNGEE